MPGEYVSARYLEVLGIRPAYGAGVSWNVAGAAPAPSILLGDDYWRRRFAGDPRVIGTVLEVDGRPLTVMGVLPRGFRGLTGRAEIWMPFPTLRAASMTQAAAHQYDMVARLRRDVSPVQAKDVVSAAGVRLAESFSRPGDPWGPAAYEFDEVRLTRRPPSRSSATPRVA